MKAALAAAWDWFHARKAPIGSLIVALAGVEMVNPAHRHAWDFVFAFGTFLAGGGMLKRDSAVRATQAFEKEGIDRRNP